MFGTVDDQRAPAAWDAARVLALAETGAPEAKEQLHGAVHRLRSIPEDWLWLTAVSLLADACICLVDHVVAVDLHSRLWPHRDEVVIVAHGIASLGPVMPRLEALHHLTTIRDADARRNTISESSREADRRRTGRAGRSLSTQESRKVASLVSDHQPRPGKHLPRTTKDPR